MSRPPPEVADILNQHGDQYRADHRGHLSLAQLQVMSAIQRCRTQTLGGHVLHCMQCDDQLISYNSCRNRHCPKCCGSKAQQWLEDRKSELLPVEYHVEFTLPAQIADIAYQNKAVVYDLLFRASAEALRTITADPKHLGAKIGFTSVLHSWGSALTHHPHVHCIVPDGGLVEDRSRYTHRLAISNHRLVSHNEQGVTFNWKDYRSKCVRYKPMTLTCDEFIRRFLIHVLPKGFHRIRHYGLLASHVRRKNLVRLRLALNVFVPEPLDDPKEKAAPFLCRTCGEPLRIIEPLNAKPRAPP